MHSSNRKKTNHEWCNSPYPHRANGGPVGAPNLGVMEPLATKLTETQYYNILQSMDQGVHIYDLDLQIIFWNRAAEKLYGYTAAEAYGKTPTELAVDRKYASLSDYLLERIASVVKLKMKTGDIDMDDEDEGEASTPRGHTVSPFGEFFSTSTKMHFTRKVKINYGDESENKQGIRKILFSKADAWMGKKRTVWSQKGNGRVESFDPIFGHFGWQRVDIIQEHGHGPQMSSNASSKLDSQLLENTKLGDEKVEASGLWFSSSKASTTSRSSSSSSSRSSSGTSIKNNVIIKVERETDNKDCKILWEDLIVREQIGQGSCGTVYRALWCGSVCFQMLQSSYLRIIYEYPGDLMISFKKEVTLMKKLRHPNILLFMGSVTSLQHLCIVTEFLPRGSLFRVLHRNTTRLDLKRCLHMAIDIARGMNYLHHCKPPIVHRDLKSPNVLVDKNWTVKVGDFGLSRIKRHTYLKTKSGKGTPQWMAPEVLRNEQADEKSDVYSYGVVLWEITTEKIPWDDLNPIQVIGAVGFMNRRLEIPKDVDPLWASLIESCLCSQPQSRPTFQEILLFKLKDLQKKLVVEPRRTES
ncbi:hypothetical protein LXL04_032336 [Taraxacum kok-saghyz]